MGTASDRRYTGAMLLVDGRVLNDHYPGVRDFWLPILAAWACQGGEGVVLFSSNTAAPTQLIEAGFEGMATDAALRSPAGLWQVRREVGRIAPSATLSPLYLTLTGSACDIATVFDFVGRDHALSVRSRLLWEATLRWTVMRADRLACASHSVAERLRTAGARHVGVVQPVAPSPSKRPSVAALARLGLPATYALAIASHRPHKRLAELRRAWLRAEVDVPLVLIGADTGELTSGERVLGLGFVPEATVSAALAGAAVLLSASADEGFGLPVLNAMAAGVPVCATHCEALEEVAGDYAEWFAGSDIDGLVGAAAARCRADDPTRPRLPGARAAKFDTRAAASSLGALLPDRV